MVVEPHIFTEFALFRLAFSLKLRDGQNQIVPVLCRDLRPESVSATDLLFDLV